jgi:asparagine synthase (glutamine-hydrolysing)
MSVQAGIWEFEGNPADQQLLARISQNASQYGLDGEKTYVNGSLGMLYRPFHTTKESRLEQQPYESGRGAVVTWDGRLDNRDDLCRQLGLDIGVVITDVAIVTAAFECWRTGCFRRFVGDWAFSAWEPDEQRLTLARDYAGIRHLFYHLTNGRIMWCSYLSPIVLLSNSSFEIDDEYIAGYLAFYPEPDRTPYREVRSVPPASFVEVKRRKAAIHRYWALNPGVRLSYKTDRDYEEHFRHLFRQAVRRRLRSDSPVLAELSGGLDSSSIVCVADDIIAAGEADTPRLDTLSYYSTQEPTCDERPYFTRIEQRRGRTGCHVNFDQYSDLHPFVFSEFAAVPDRLGGTREKERDRRNLMLQQGNRISLSGLGGDEFLGGVPTPEPQLADLLVQFRLPEFARQLVAWSLVRRLPILKLFLQTLAVLLPPSLRALVTPQGKVLPWIAPGFARRYRIRMRQLGPTDRFGFVLPSRQDTAQTLAAMTWQLSFTQPPLVGHEERRYPCLDQNLIEFLAAIPASQLLRPGERRSLMRRALAGIVPAEILSRKGKSGAARGIVIDLQRDWNSVENALTDPLSASLGYVNAEKLADALDALKSGKTEHLGTVVSALMIELWMRDVARRGLIRAPRAVPSSMNFESSQA